ncbi:MULTISPECIES: mechanosensitive ion channel family protein [unclassified Carboxylicivirga]|uniref:mechanosensitive ion channel family protein n=1 Tax=Carboxylicivirga TaxID=1628153 RepID=UPI003D333AE0
MRVLRFITLVWLQYCLTLLPSLAINTQTTDTLKVESIDLIDIPSESAISINKLNQLEKSILSEHDLMKLLTRSKAKMLGIDSLYAAEQDIDLMSFNKRHLLNKRTFWRQRREQLILVEQNITDELSKIETISQSIFHDKKRWDYISQVISAENNETFVNANIDRVLAKNDTLLRRVKKQGNRLLEIQDKAITQQTNISTLIDRIDQRIQAEEDNIFKRSPLHPAQFLKPDAYTTTLPLLAENIKIEARLLAEYLKDNQSNIFLFILLIILGILGFNRLKKAMSKQENQGNTAVYAIQLNKLLQSNKSALALIIIWLSGLVFPNQPLFFKDIMRLTLCFPVAFLLHQLIDKRLFRPLIVIYVLIAVQVVVNQLPPGHILYRLFLSVASLTAAILLLKLHSQIKNHTFKSLTMAKLIKRLLLVSAMLVAFTLILGLYGFLALNEFMVNVILINTLSISLLYVSVLIANGLLEHLFNKPRLRNYKVFEHYGRPLQKHLMTAISFLSKLAGLYILFMSVNADEEVIAFFRELITRDFKLSSNVSFSIGGTFLLVIILYLSVLLSNIIKVLLEEDVLSKTNLSQGLPHTFALLAKYAFITVGIVLAVNMAGIPTSSLTVLLGAFGVGIGFGLQNIFNNLVSGLILLFERPIKIDDVVEVGQLLGKVKSIGIRSSVVRTFDGAEVIVPNGNLISNEVINWTHSDPIRRHEVFVGVAYGSDVSKVKDILKEQLGMHTDILKDPEPSVLFVSLGDSSLDFRVLFWISKVQEGLKIKSEVTKMIYEALNKEGIQIPFPQRDIHIIKEKEKQAPENI